MRRTEKCMLLASLCAFESLLKEAVAGIGDEQLFDNLSDPDCAFVWSALADYYKSVGELPKPITMRSEIETRLWGIPGLPGSMVEATKALSLWVGQAAKAEALSEALGRKYLQEAIAEGIRVKWTRGVAKLRSIDDMALHAERARRDMALLRAPTEDARCDLFGRPEDFLVKAVRRPTGVHPIDMILGGGVSNGEVMGMVAPTGCGKTSFCVAMLSEWVQLGEKVMLFTYEQDAKGDLAERFFSYALAESIETFRDQAYDELPDEIKERVQHIAPLMRENLTVVNMADPDLRVKLDPRDPASDMRDYIERNHKEGKPPSLVMLDWFGAKILQLASFSAKQYESPYQVYGQALIDGVRDLAKQYQFAAVITQQLSTQASAKSASVKPMNTDVLNFKTFFNFMDSGLLFGTQVKGAKRVGWAVAGKNRRGSTGDRMIVFDGARGKIEDANGNYIEDHLGRIVPKDAKEHDGERVI